MNAKLMEEREKAQKLLMEAQRRANKWNFDLSDLKNDKTQYLDRSATRLQSNQNSPFEPKEISARSTIKPSSSSNLDFDTIMKTSVSEAVRNKYRESMTNGRLSSTGTNTNLNRPRSTQSNQDQDFWDDANPSFSSFTGKNLTYSNEDFKPAEMMGEQLEEDEKMQEMEYAPIPKNKVAEISNWEEPSSSSTSSRLPEMSFGQYCARNIAFNNIREIYGAQSPPKRQNRVPLVEVTTNESLSGSDSNPNYFDTKKLEKFIKNNHSPQPDKIINTRRSSAIKETNEPNYSNSISKIIDDLNFNKIMETAEAERNRTYCDQENIRAMNDVIPVQDDDHAAAQNELQLPNRGLKRRPSSISSDTPRSALEKCHRSKSPTHRKELEVAAARLKPQMIPNNESIFKMPLPCDSTLKYASSSISLNKTQSKVLTKCGENSTVGREYVTAMQSLSIRSPGEKLSLPNYALQRPKTSPTSSVRSHSRFSPNGSHFEEGKLRRSASQISNGSEFQDDFLPIKIKNIENKKLSFESVKIEKSVTKTVSIQNGSDKKLSIRVKIIGAGFSVTPREEFRMVPMEARTFYVKFSPSVVGPARGSLIFEHATNKMCSKSIPLYGYGGHSSIQIDGIMKGPFGPPFITMAIFHNMHYVSERRMKLTNNGTLPGFASLVFERTKLSDFALSDSLSMHPTKVKIDPGRSVEIKIRFSPTKSEIRKLMTATKEVTTIGEICIICGDEPTRLRILNNENNVDPKFLTYLPKSLPNEAETKAKLQKFNEELSRAKLTTIMGQIRTHEIALTVNKSLDESQMIASEISLADDTQMSFETFVDTNNTRINMVDTIHEMNEMVEDSNEILESKFFRIKPAVVLFHRSLDTPETSKIIEVESTCEKDLYIEGVASNFQLLKATRSCGKLRSKQTIEIKVNATQKAFDCSRFNNDNMFLMILIGDARIEIPIRFID